MRYVGIVEYWLSSIGFSDYSVVFSWKSHFKNFIYHIQKLKTCFFLIEGLLKADNTKKLICTN